MRRLALTITLATFAFSHPALSQECDPNDESQMGMNICAAADYKAEDAKLNRAYREIVKRLADSPEDKKLLQTAQRDWIAFRDAECAFSTNDSKDGSIYPMLLSQCLADLTDARAKQLGAYLDCEEGDMSCPVPPAQ